MAQEPLKQKKVILESYGVNPFRNWSDWHSEEVIVTFETMKHNLWNSWENQCTSIEGETELVEKENGMYEMKGDTERKVEPEKFDLEKLKKPGVYRDSKNNNDEEKVDESYTIIVGRSFLSPELCQKWIQKLNEKFDRNFSLDIKDRQLSPEAEIRELKARTRDNDLEEKLEELIDEI
jgi:hypothetical protein